MSDFPKLSLTAELIRKYAVLKSFKVEHCKQICEALTLFSKIK